MKMREELGLPPLPPTIYAHEDELAKVRDVLFSKFVPKKVEE